MAITRKTGGQSNPAASTDTTLYTVPGGTEAVVQPIVVSNHGSTAATFDIWIVPTSGTATANQYRITPNIAIPAKDRFSVAEGFPLAAGETIKVRASTANLTFYCGVQEVA